MSVTAKGRIEEVKKSLLDSKQRIDNAIATAEKRHEENPENFEAVSDLSDLATDISDVLDNHNTSAE